MRPRLGESGPVFVALGKRATVDGGVSEFWKVVYAGLGVHVAKSLDGKKTWVMLNSIEITNVHFLSLRTSTASKWLGQSLVHIRVAAPLTKVKGLDTKAKP